MRILTALPVSLLIVASLGGRQNPPSLLIYNARVFTGLAATPWADAVAISGERIAAVGTNGEIRKLAGAETRSVDAGGRLVIPGINDAHVHIAADPPQTRLKGPSAVDHDPTLDEVLTRLKVAVAGAPNGGWITGEIGGTVIDDPKATRFALDTIAPAHPVMLTAWTGHGVLMNTAAVRFFGLRDDEPDPAGGFYGRMPNTRTLSGWAHEYAEYRLRQRLTAAPDRRAQTEAFRTFGREAAELGVTSVQSMMTSLPAGEAARVLAGGDSPIRVRVIDFPMNAMADWRAPASRGAQSTPRVTVSGTKWILDGTPVERLMFLRAPFTDRPASRGRLNFPAADLEVFLRRALETGEQPLFHAVGDAAIDTVLDGLGRTGGERWKALRQRLEHGEMLEPSHYDRARRSGVVLVQNPSHFMIAPVMNARIGKRAHRTDMLKSAIAAGVPVALGSDGPLNPFLNMMFATINATNPAEAMTREQVIAAYTFGSAYAEHREHEKGTIAPGMLADLAVLSQDIFAINPDALPATRSLMTVVGGRVVYDDGKW